MYGRHEERQQFQKSSKGTGTDNKYDKELNARECYGYVRRDLGEETYANSCTHADDRSDPLTAPSVSARSRSGYIPLGPPETPNKGSKLIKNAKVSSGDALAKSEKVQDEVASKWKTQKGTGEPGENTVTRIPSLVKGKKPQELGSQGDLGSDKRPESRTSISSYHKNCCSELRSKSKISIGNYRNHPYAAHQKVKDYIANSGSLESQGASQGDLTQCSPSKSGNTKMNGVSDNEEGSLINSTLTEKTNTFRDENGVVYGRGCTASCDRRSYKTVLLIEDPKRCLMEEEEVYKVQTSSETVSQVHKPTQIFNVPRAIVQREGQKLGCCLQGCGIPKKFFHKPLMCGKNYQFELGEHLMFEEKKMPCEEAHNRSCIHGEAICNCCDFPHFGHCCQEPSEFKHRANDPCLHSFIRTNSNEKRFTLCKQVPYDFVSQIYERIPLVHAVPPMTMSDNSCGGSKMKNERPVNGYSSNYVRPVSVIPAIRKYSKTRFSNWQVPPYTVKFCQNRPKSATPEGGIKKVTSDNVRIKQKKHCGYPDQQPLYETCPPDPISVIGRGSTNDQGTTESDDCPESEGKKKNYFLNNNFQRPLKKKKIMRICNCPHLHMEDNNIKKFCIHQCSNSKKEPNNGTEGKEPSSKSSDIEKLDTDRKYVDKKTSARVLATEDKEVYVKNSARLAEARLVVDNKKRLLIKSTTALIANDKDGDDRRNKESLRNRMLLGDPRKKCSVATDTKEGNGESDPSTNRTAPKLDKCSLSRKTQSTQANDEKKERQGSANAKAKVTISLKETADPNSANCAKRKNVFTKTDKDLIFFPFEAVQNSLNIPGDRKRVNEALLLKKPITIRSFERDGTEHRLGKSEGRTLVTEKGRCAEVTQGKKCSEKDKSLNLLKLYEDLTEFQRLLSTQAQAKESTNPERKDGGSGKSSGDRLNEEQVHRKKLRYRLAQHLQELLKISDEYGQPS